MRINMRLLWRRAPAIASAAAVHLRTMRCSVYDDCASWRQRAGALVCCGV